MKVLITGATGFIGGHLVQRLLQDGHEIRALARESSDTQQLKKLKVEIFQGDLKNKESLSGIMDEIDSVIHAGACTGGAWQDFQGGTIIGTQNILELSSEANIKKLIYISSIDVYGINGVEKDSIVNEATLVEGEPNKVGPYARSKIISEKLVQDFQQQAKFSIVIVRPGIVYGPPRRKTFLQHIGFSLLGGKVFFKIGTGRKILPLTYIDNTIEAIIELLKNKRADGQTYNIIDPKKIKQSHYLDYHFNRLGLKTFKFTIPYSVFLAFALLNEKLSELPKIGKFFGLTRYRLNAKFKRVRYDGTKIMRHLDWYPPVKLEDGLERTLSYLSNQAK